jgi:hypothetical protein
VAFGPGRRVPLELDGRTGGDGYVFLAGCGGFMADYVGGLVACWGNETDVWVVGIPCGL